MSSLIQAACCTCSALFVCLNCIRIGFGMVSPVKAYLLLKDFSKWSGHDAVHITRAHNRLVLVPSSAPKIFLFVGAQSVFYLSCTLSPSLSQRVQVRLLVYLLPPSRVEPVGQPHALCSSPARSVSVGHSVHTRMHTPWATHCTHTH
jgi:hypothetical protein